MKERSFDEMISYFNRRVADMDISQDCKMELLGMVTALGYKHEKTAQPEIIRCKDCKYMTEHYDTDGNVPYWTCSEWDSGTDYDGYCHYAERRTDEIN